MFWHISYIDKQFKNDKIKTILDVEFYGKLHYVNELLKEHHIVISDSRMNKSKYLKKHYLCQVVSTEVKFLMVK